MKVLFIDTTHPVLPQLLKAKGVECIMADSLSKEEIENILPAYDGIVLRSRFKLDADFIEKGKELKFIARPGAGLENIDVTFAESKGIKCFRSPEGNRDSVAEHAIGMLLALFNNLFKADAEVRAGIWNRTANWGVELKGKTVGIIGYGFMGEAFAQRLSGFDVKVIVYDKYKKNYAHRGDYIVESTLEYLFEESDVVSLHVPLTAETLQMVNTNFFKQFKKNIYLINTARGGIVNLTDLSAAIKNGKVLGACLDVFEFEEQSFEHTQTSNSEGMQYLIQSNKVLLSPHIAGWTKESNEKIARVIGEKIISEFNL